MTDIPFCEIFSLISLLKFSFWSRYKPKCFWEILHSTGTSLKKTWGLKGFTVFREKISYWACLVILELNIIFYWYAHFKILFKSFLISLVETLMLFTIEEIDVSSKFYVCNKIVRKIIYVASYQIHLLSSIYRSNPHTKPYQKLLIY